MKTWPENLYEFVGITISCEADDLYHAIVTATSVLDRDDWKMLLMRFTCGYSNDEIASKAGVSKQTVKNHFVHIREALRSATVLPLLQYGYTEGMKRVHAIFLDWEDNAGNVPVDVAFPEPCISNALIKADVSVCSEIKEDPESIKGIGPKSAATIKDRIADLGHANVAPWKSKELCVIRRAHINIQPVDYALVRGGCRR